MFTEEKSRAGTPDMGNGLAVLEAWLEDHSYLYLPIEAFDFSQELVLWPQFARFCGFRGDRQQIGEADDTGAGLECRLENVRIGNISPGYGGRLRGLDEESSATFDIQQRREHRGAVEPRQAQPIDRSITRDERRRSAVADNRVIIDGWLCCRFAHWK